jgi:hypothetical protein
MKILLSDLKRIIKEELIREAAFSPSDAINRGMALYSYADDAGLFETFVLYKAYGQEVEEQESKLRPGMKMNVVTRDSIYNGVTSGPYDITAVVNSAVVGAIRVAKKTKEQMAYVDGVKTQQKGYGPLLYDIALRYHGPIMQSPVSVSADAKRIWKGYQTMRKKDVDYKKGSPPQIALKARTSVDVRKLKETHDVLPEMIQKALLSKPSEFRFDMTSFKKSLEDALYRRGQELVSTLHM